MSPVRDRPSIAWRLTAINLLVSGSALLLAAVALGVYDRSTFRETVVRNLSIQDEIAGTNCVSALVFNDRQTAETTLAALSAWPNIVSAEIYGPDGRVFALYARDPKAPEPQHHLGIPAGENEAHDFGADRIVVARRITFQGKSLGSISISSDVQELDARRNRMLAILAAVMLASFLVALFLSRVLQRSISGPIARLADVAKKVSGEQDYSVRATVEGNTAEMGVMVHAFNDMLTQIERHDRELLDAQHQLEDRVRERTTELDATNKELEAFSYSVSHDLRAPLRHITGFCALLQGSAGASLSDKDRRYLKTIEDAAKRMGRLIDDLLSFSRMSRSTLEVRSVNLDALVSEARQEPACLPSNGSAIEWKIHALPQIDGDPALLQLALVNLLSNAVKYSSVREHPTVEVGVASATADETVVYVRDNGVGFDMKYVDKLFGVFQRLHSSDQFEGTGIGLANVRRIIARHGGRVWAEGAVDQGAAFYFSLPRTRT